LFRDLKYITIAKPTFCVALVRVSKSKILTLTESTTSSLKRATCLLLFPVTEIAKKISGTSCCIWGLEVHKVRENYLNG
ncbi:MAG: hypothetical protein SOZ34_01305, partial [Clostridia bacterium]|nr:hypothetical protein [Clostridia bacterium]